MLVSNIYCEDIQQAIRELPTDEFQKKTVLITGATGMFCSCIADILMEMRQTFHIDVKIAVVGRDLQKLGQRFPEWREAGVELVKFDAAFPTILEQKADYIIHGGSNADPVSFTRYPVETMLTNVYGTKSLLDTGIRGGMERFLYISSGEVYGQPDKDMNDFDEAYSGWLDYASPRSCYPAGKRAAEVLCQSYISEYSIDCVIARPCHLFGPTIRRSDSRAVSEFLWSAVDKKSIVLKSAGLRERSHCYVVDAAKAVLHLLIRGGTGEAYNIADKRYQMTVRRFAEETAHAGGCEVTFELPSDVEVKGYSTTSRAVLSSVKLEQTGWRPYDSEISNIEKTVSIMREIRNRSI